MTLIWAIFMLFLILPESMEKVWVKLQTLVYSLSTVQKVYKKSQINLTQELYSNVFYGHGPWCTMFCSIQTDARQGGRTITRLSRIKIIIICSDSCRQALIYSHQIDAQISDRLLLPESETNQMTYIRETLALNCCQLCQCSRVKTV